MPIIIDSKNGQRTCRLVNNKQNVVDDIIQALKGLTLKIELKISDVIPANNVDSTSNHSAQNPNEKPLTQTSQPVSQASTVQKGTQPFEATPGNLKSTIPSNTELDKNKTSPDIVLENGSIPASQSNARLIDLVRNQLKSEGSAQVKHSRDPVETKPPVTEPRQDKLNLDKSSEPTPTLSQDHETIAEVSPKLKELSERPKPKLIRGTLKIGSMISTCCLSFNSQVDPPAIYISYDSDKLLQVSNLLEDLTKQIDSLPEATFFSDGDIVYGKSLDDNKWYRAIVEKVDGLSVNILFFDWGMRETLSLSRLRPIAHQSLGLSNHPACAVRIQLKASEETREKFLQSEHPTKLRVDSYDPVSEMYDVMPL